MFALGGVLLLAAARIAAAIVISSESAPTGQVVARVGLVDITREDVAAEARAQGLRPTAALSPSLVQAVIARALLAREARRRGLERAASFPRDARRARAQLLASGVVHALPSPPAPTPFDIQAYLVAHPERFAQRQRWLLNELQYAASRAPDVAGATVDEARARLDAAHAPFQAFKASSFSGDLPLALQHALSVTPPGRLAVWCAAGLCTAIGVEASEAAPLEGALAQIAAREALEREARERQVKALVDQLRAREHVRLQPAGELD